MATVKEIMIFRLIEKTYDDVDLDSDPVSTEWIDIGGEGCDTVAYQVVISNSSTPDGSIQLEGSLDKTTVIPVGDALDVTQDGVLEAAQDRPLLRWYRLTYSVDSGSFTASTKVLAKGDKD